MGASLALYVSSVPAVDVAASLNADVRSLYQWQGLGGLGMAMKASCLPETGIIVAGLDLLDLLPLLYYSLIVSTPFGARHCSHLPSPTRLPASL